MADLVGSIVAQADPGRGGATTPGIGAGPAAQGTQGNHKDAASRIDALVAQRNEAQRRFQAAEQRVVDLESRFATLEGRINQQPVPASERGLPHSWSDLSDAELQKSYVEAGEASNWNGQLAINQELQHRSAEKAKVSATQTTESLLQHQRLLQEVSSKIQTEFGADARPGSPLYERADVYASSFSQKYGQNILKQIPDLIFTSFAMADRDLRMSERQELQDLRAQVDRFKAQQSIEPGAVRGARNNAEVAEALKRGDIGSAIDNLGIVKRMAERR